MRYFRVSRCGALARGEVRIEAETVAAAIEVVINLTLLFAKVSLVSRPIPSQEYLWQVDTTVSHLSYWVNETDKEGNDL